jgi:hypothetical protein
MDVSALVNVIMPDMKAMLEAVQKGRPPINLDKEQINAKLALLPDKPDENLR